MRKNAKKWITLQCAECKQDFEKELTEYHRQQRRCSQKEFFCNHKCQGVSQAKFSVDELSPFRFLFKNLKNACRTKNLDNDFDVKFLKTLWESQKGICPYTGIQMILPYSSSTASCVHSLEAASLDRIDSDKGYTKENVEFICRFVNLGKNKYPKEEVVNFLKKIKG